MLENILYNEKTKEIEIRIPMGIIKYAQEWRPDYPCYHIIDDDAAGKWLAEQLLCFGEDECGDTELERLLDALFTEAYENGVPWLQEMWHEKYGMETT